MGIHSNFNLHQVKKICRQDENPLKMNKLLILILALALITAEAAPQFWPSSGASHNSGGKRDKFKAAGASLVGAGIATKVIAAKTNNPALYNAGKTIATLGAVKTVGAHLFQGK